MSDPTEMDKAAREAADEWFDHRAEVRDEVLSDGVRGDIPCSGCGTRENIVWFTDNTLWNMVIREPGGHYEGNEPILCISCFVMAVHQRGMVPTGWRLLPEWPIRSLCHPIHGASPATERVPADVVPSPGEIGTSGAVAEGCKQTQDDKAAAESWWNQMLGVASQDVERLAAWRAEARAEGRRERDREVKRIETRCPSCNRQTLFISPGGHLTCSWIGGDNIPGCKRPSVEESIADLAFSLDYAETERDEARAALARVRALIQSERDRPRKPHMLLLVMALLNQFEEAIRG